MLFEFSLPYTLKNIHTLYKREYMKIQYYIFFLLIFGSCQNNTTSSKNEAHNSLHAIFDAEKKYKEKEFPYWSDVKANL
ncbi:MAG: hypothetical protein ACI9XO_004895 [Paraglaciecola sp.]